MEAFMNGLLNLVTTYQPLVVILVTVALAICGVACIIPSKKTKEFALEAIPFVAIGCGLVICAVTIAKEVATAWTF